MDHHDNGVMPGLAAPASGTSDCVAPVGSDGAAAIAVAPQRETASVASADRFEGQSKWDDFDFLTAETKRKHDDALAAAARRKAFETWRAKLARQGHQLHELADGSFMVSRWNLTRDLADLDAVAEFARKVGAA